MLFYFVFHPANNYYCQLLRIGLIVKVWAVSLSFAYLNSLGHFFSTPPDHLLQNHPGSLLNAGSQVSHPSYQIANLSLALFLLSWFPPLFNESRVILAYPEVWQSLFLGDDANNYSIISWKSLPCSRASACVSCQSVQRDRARAWC